LYYRKEPEFLSFSRIRFLPAEKSVVLKPNDRFSLRFSTEAPAHLLDFIRAHPAIKSRIGVAIFSGRVMIKKLIIGPLSEFDFSESVVISFDPALDKGEYWCVVLIETPGIRGSRNSRIINLWIE
jgi:hypothetical protein